MDEIKMEFKKDWTAKSEDDLCIECRRVHTASKDKVCKVCKTRPKLTPEEETYVQGLKDSYNQHRVRYDEKAKNPDLDFLADEDYWGMRNIGFEIHQLGKEKKMYLWDGVNLYGGVKKIKFEK